MDLNIREIQIVQPIDKILIEQTKDYINSKQARAKAKRTICACATKLISKCFFSCDGFITGDPFKWVFSSMTLLVLQETSFWPLSLFLFVEKSFLFQVNISFKIKIKIKVKVKEDENGQLSHVF